MVLVPRPEWFQFVLIGIEEKYIGGNLLGFYEEEFINFSYSYP